MVVVSAVIQNRHALERGMQGQTEQSRPWQTVPAKLSFAVLTMIVGVKVAMLNALGQVFQEPLDKETANHKHTSERRGSKGFRNQMQEAHADDERPSKRQDDAEVVQAALTEKDKHPAPEEGGQQEDEGSQQHASGFILGLKLGQDHASG